MDLSGVYAANNSAHNVQKFTKLIEEQTMKELSEKRLKDRQERENHDNLDFIANSSKESIEILKEMLKLQKRNCELLEEKSLSLENSLECITDILQGLFSTTIENGAIQEDLLKQANALACEISYSLDQGQKIDFKDKAADIGVQGIITAIGILLKMRGIIP